MSLVAVCATALVLAGCGGSGFFADEFVGDVELANFAGPDFFVEGFYMFPFSGGATGNLLFLPLPNNTIEHVATLVEDTYDAEADVYDAFFDVTNVVIFPPDDVISGFVTTYTVN